MTTIFSKDGVLYADRKIAHYGNVITFTNGPKIFVSQDGQFAYGNAGAMDREDDRLKREVVLRKFIQSCILQTDQQGCLKLTEDQRELLNGVEQDYIILTKTKSLLIKSGEKKVWAGDHTPIYALGSGGWIVHGMVMAGMAPDKAIDNLGDYDTFSGGGVDKIIGKKLKTFRIGGGDE